MLIPKYISGLLLCAYIILVPYSRQIGRKRTSITEIPDCVRSVRQLVRLGCRIVRVLFVVLQARQCANEIQAGIKNLQFRSECTIHIGHRLQPALELVPSGHTAVAHLGEIQTVLRKQVGYALAGLLPPVPQVFWREPCRDIVITVCVQQSLGRLRE